MYSSCFCFHWHGGRSGSEHTKSINISTTWENQIPWNIYTHVGIIRGICYYHLSFLSFKELILDFMSRRNDTQAGITHITMKYLLSTTEEQGLNCYLPFQIKHSQDLKMSHSCQRRGDCTGEGTQAAQGHSF